MTEIIVEDPVWQAIMNDPRLANARRKLSFHEIRLIVRHAQAGVSRTGGDANAAPVSEAN